MPLRAAAAQRGERDREQPAGGDPVQRRREEQPAALLAAADHPVADVRERDGGSARGCVLDVDRVLHPRLAEDEREGAREQAGDRADDEAPADRVQTMVSWRCER